jgi:hypothetical protein
VKSVISLEKVLERFKNTDFSQKVLVRYYHSSVQIFALITFLKGQSRKKIFELEEKYQWPVLKHLNNPELEIYKNSDVTLRDMFIELINEGERARMRSWKELHSIIEQRTKLYKYIFDFNKKDMEYCRKLAERYENWITKRKKRAKLKGLAIGAGQD